MLNREAWAETAAGGILSKQERERTRQELLDHIEDHAEALQAAGVPEKEAFARATAAMGDPLKVAAMLRKVHQPVLTRILQWTKKAALLLLVITVWNTLLFSNWEPRLGWIPRPFDAPDLNPLLFQTEPLPDSVSWRMLAYPEGEREVGDYTVMLRRVSVTYDEENPRAYEGGTAPWFIVVELQFRPHRFWQSAANPFYDFSLRSADWECRTDTEPFALSLYPSGYDGILQLTGSFPTLPQQL